MLRIESQKNETFRRLLSLTGAKGLKEEKLFLLSGEKLVREFLRAPNLGIVHEIIAPNAAPLTQDATRHLQLTPELFRGVDVLGTHANILVLEQPAMAALTTGDLAAYKPQGIEVVVPTGDPGNLGALLRSCEAFGAPRVLLTQEAAHPFLPKAVKASAGSVLRLPLLQAPSLRDFPRDCIALDMDGQPLGDFAWPANGLLVVGEEGPGLAGAESRGAFTQRIRIPTQGVESLNAVVAASIALAFKATSRRHS